MRHLALIVLLLTPTAPPCLARAVEVELREGAEVGAMYFTLGDIATVRSDEAGVAERMGAQRIGRAPRIGQTLGVTRMQVATRIARLLPQLRDEITWRGPTQVSVRGTGQSMLPDDYVPVAESFLSAWLGERYPAHRIESRATRTPVSLPFGTVAVQARLPASAVARKRMSVWLDFTVDGEHYRSVPVWFAVEASGPGFVAATDLAAGASPTAALVRPATVTVTGACDALADRSRLDGQFRLRRAVAAGQPLCAENLGELPAVVRGDQLTVTARSGAVVVSTLAVALEDGQPGQTIDVRRGERGARFEVLVTGTRQAQVSGVNDE